MPYYYAWVVQKDSLDLPQGVMPTCIHASAEVDVIKVFSDIQATETQKQEGFNLAILDIKTNTTLLWRYQFGRRPQQITPNQQGENGTLTISCNGCKYNDSVDITCMYCSRQMPQNSEFASKTTRKGKVVDPEFAALAGLDLPAVFLQEHNMATWLLEGHIKEQRTIISFGPSHVHDYQINATPHTTIAQAESLALQALKESLK